MKTNSFTPTVLLFSLTLIMAACSSSKTTKKYPYPGSPVPQERKPGGESPTDKNPNDGKTVVVTNPSNLPPGQAKKIYGTKSAKVFAPGQRKKNGGYYPIIIYRTPSIIILRHADGRYYYKNEDNYIYWQGNDDRFYLDEKHMNDVAFNEKDLDDWKEKGKKHDVKEEKKEEKKEDKNEEKKTPPGQQKKENNDNQHGNGKGKGKSKNR
jgi:hypothetical protein